MLENESVQQDLVPANAWETVPLRTISFALSMHRMREAWRAASTLDPDGDFVLAISPGQIRLLAEGEVDIEGIVPITELVGLEDAAEIHLKLAVKGLSALGEGDLDDQGSILIESLQMEEGFTGFLQLRTSFNVTWPYTLTKIADVALELDAHVETPVDPRTIRTAIADVRYFVGEDDRAGNDLGTLQIVGGEALGMSRPAGQSIHSKSLSEIQLRVPHSCIKKLSSLLGQLRPADTKLTIHQNIQMLNDERLKIKIPIASALCEWPSTGPLIAQFKVGVQELLEAIRAITIQNQAKDASITFAVRQMKDSLALGTEVPDGMAIATCPISFEHREQADPVELELSSDMLGSFNTRQTDAVTIRIFKRFVELDQISANEHRKTFVTALRKSEPV